ncbi:MAG: hypothetical protein ACLFUS_08500 [Candidatus Sumerlaeia bacterium]
MAVLAPILIVTGLGAIFALLYLIANKNNDDYLTDSQRAEMRAHCRSCTMAGACMGHKFDLDANEDLPCDEQQNAEERSN